MTSSKIQILFVIIQMKVGGAEKLVFDLISGLDLEKYSPSIAWFVDGDMIDKFKKLNIPMHYISKEKRFDLKAMAKLSKIIKENDIKIVNAHHFMPLVYSFYGCKIFNKIKLVYTEHSIWEIKPSSLKWHVVKSYLLRHVDAIIGVSGKVVDSIQKIYSLDDRNMYAVQNGVNLNELCAKKDPYFFCNISSKDIKIIMVANFRKNKNHVFLLKAFNHLSKLRDDIHLFFIGQGFQEDTENSENEIKALIAKFGLSEKVTLLGYCDNVLEQLCHADIACLTSDREGLPISLIESMATGLPVVGTNVEGIADVIVHDYNGYLVDKGNVIELRDALYSLVVDEEKRRVFGNRSKEIAFENYSMEKCIQKYQLIFESEVNASSLI